jgi:hypothetical protein
MSSLSPKTLERLSRQTTWTEEQLHEKWNATPGELTESQKEEVLLRNYLGIIQTPTAATYASKNQQKYALIRKKMALSSDVLSEAYPTMKRLT